MTTAIVAPLNYVLPLTNEPLQFPISLAGISYVITNKWNDMGQYWCLDIADENGDMIVANVPLITGDDCLDGLAYLGFQGSIYVYSAGSSPFDPPTLVNLGVDCDAYFQTSVASD